MSNEEFDIIAEDPIEIIAEEAVEEITEEVKVEESEAKELAVEEPVKKTVKKKEEPKAATMVAVYSSRSVSWEGVGSVKRGYNILTPEQADRWLKRVHVRLATPDEIRGAASN
jgi:hypothetical protein